MSIHADPLGLGQKYTNVERDFAGQWPTEPLDSHVANAADFGDKKMWGEDGFGFDDFLDLINPLQHIPVVNTIYRELTGDQIEPGARMVGGALFGGPIGFAASLANTMIEEATGRDLGENLLAMFSGDEASEEARQTQLAQAEISNPANADPQMATAVQAQILAQAQPNALRSDDKKDSPRRNISPTATTMAGFSPLQQDALENRMSPAQFAAMHAKGMPFGGPVSPEVSTMNTGTGKQMRAAMDAAMGQTPRLSPQAFDALMQSLGAVPIKEGESLESAVQARQVPPQTSAPTARVASPVPVEGNEHRAAAMELHNMLQDRFNASQASLQSSTASPQVK